MQRGTGGVASFQDLLRGIKSGIDTSIVQHQGAFAAGNLFICTGDQVSLLHCCGRPCLPLHVDHLGRALGSMIGVCYHQHPTRHRVGRIIKHQALLIALYTFCSTVVDRLHRRPIAGRRQQWFGVDHSLIGCVDTVDSRALAFRGHIKSQGVYANKFAILGGFQRQTG